MSTTDSTTEQTKTVTTTGSTDATQQTPLSGNELKEAIKRQVEFYFSPQNLPSDAYLLANMDNEQYVPISLIATFGKIVALTSDQNIIVDSLSDSQSVEFSADKTKIRPKELPKRRNRLILHTLPSETTDQEVKDLFASGNFTPEVSPDVNNCWFISFDTEEEATAGLEFIRKQKIHGKNIRARLKPEAQLRTMSQASYIPQYSVYPSFIPSAGDWAPMYWGDSNAENFNQNLDGKDGNRRNYKNKGRKDANRKGYDGNKKRSGGHRKNKRDQKKQPAAPLGPSDFPPLPTGDTKHTGYSTDFIQYSSADLVASLKKLEPKKPADLGEQYPVLPKASVDLEVDNIVPIEVGDLPVRTAPVPLSERVKSSPAAKPKKAPQPVKVQEKPKPTPQQSKPVKTKQEEAKGSSWSQIAKKGNQKSKSKAVARPNNANATTTPTKEK